MMIKQKSGRLKRSLSILPALVMCVSMISVTAFAQEGDTELPAVRPTASMQRTIKEYLKTIYLLRRGIFDVKGSCDCGGIERFSSDGLQKIFRRRRKTP